MLQPSAVSVSLAGPEDFDRIAELTVRVYIDGGLANEGYTPELADVAGRADRSDLLVVRDDDARAAGKRRMVLSTGTRMTAAQRLYARLGFTRLPERDWSPVPEIELLVYSREL